MAVLRPPKTPEQYFTYNLKTLRNEYATLSCDYNKLINNDYLYCHRCNTYLAKKNFYTDNDYASGVFPICKECLLKMAEQRKAKDDKPKETKDSVRHVLHFMDLPYYDELYEDCKRSIANNPDETKRSKSPFSQMMTCLKATPKYRGKKWLDGDAEFESGAIDSKKIKASTIKRFGQGLDNDDYLFLQNEYDDWLARYECNTKAQEELFERLCFKKLEIFKATRNGQNTKDLDESYQKLMNTANISPRQNSLDVLSEGQTLGQMIEKWETERPLPEIDQELEDVDKIGVYIDVFFKGHLAKMLKLKNPLSNIYDKFMKKYTVTKPKYNEEEDSEQLFDKIFGAGDE